MPVNGCKQKVKHNLCRFVTAAVHFPMLLLEQAVAQVPTFEFHSEISRLKCTGSCEHGYLSIREVKPGKSRHGSSPSSNARNPAGFA